MRVLDVIITFNTGILGKVNVLQNICGEAGSYFVIGLKSVEKMCIKEDNRTVEDIFKKATQAKTNVKRRRDEKEAK